MDIKKAIEEQRRKLDQMAAAAGSLTDLLDEGRKMDRLIEIYENEHTTA